MATIRRAYIYLVCFITLQSVLAAINGLIGSTVSWLARASALDPLSVTFQLAVIIVGTPIFVGHWLWARHSSGRDLAELNTPLRRLYLYTTKGVLVLYTAASLYYCLAALVDVLQWVAGGSGWPSGDMFAPIPHGALMALIAAALGFYHERLTNDKRLAPDSFFSSLDQLYLLAFSGLGLVTGTSGLVALLVWAMHRVDGLYGDGLAPAAAAVMVGGLAWGYHEWVRARAARHHNVGTEALRWLYAQAVVAVAALVVFIGAAGALAWIFHFVVGDAPAGLPDMLALLVAGAPALIYHEVVVRRRLAAERWQLRWGYGLVFAGLGMLAALAGLLFSIQWLVGRVSEGSAVLYDAAAYFVPGLIMWAYHEGLMRQGSRVLGLAENAAGPFRTAGRLLQRLYVFGFSGLGISLAAAGLIGLQDWVFSRFSGESLVSLATGLACLVSGVLVWLYYWRWAGRLFASRHPEESKSDLRKAYLYVIIYISVNTFIITVAVLGNGFLRALLGLPTSGSLAMPLSIITASTALWVYHALVLRQDMGRAGESGLQADMQRLYWYLVAGFGLSAFLIGLAGEVSVVISWLAQGFQADSALKELFAIYTAALVAGLPVWLSAWIPAQRTAAQPGPAAIASRRSLLRKLYLYAFSLTAVVVTLIAAVAMVYQLLNAVVGLFRGENLLAAVAQSLGFTIIAAAVWIYHGWVLRGDGQRAKADSAQASLEKQAEAEAARLRLTAEWADWPVAVVDGGRGVIGRLALDALRQDLPHLTLLAIGLTPEAAAALGVAFEEDYVERLEPAKVIVTSWPALEAGAALARHAAVKVVVPVDTPATLWVGVSPALQKSQITMKVRELLKARPAAVLPIPAATADSPLETQTVQAG
jgi:hypothetical protein